MAKHEHNRPEPQIFEVVDEAKAKSRLTYAYMSLGDYRFIAADVERERPAVLEPVRVRSGIASARAKGKPLGRPRRDVDAEKSRNAAQSGALLGAIATELGIGEGTARRTGQRV